MSEPRSVPDDVVAYWADWADYHRWYARVPGVQLAVLDDAGERLAHSSGAADLGTGEPLTDAHAFRIASHSKTFTAVCVLRLVERGLLRLDDSIDAVVAELAGSRLAAVTVRELLSHSGGVIRDSTDADFWQLSRAFPDHDQLLAIAHDPASAVLERQDQFKYSNIGFGLLGLAIEAVTGASFAAHVRESIVDRLGLSSVSADLPSDAPLAQGHSGLASARERHRLDHAATGALAAATGFVATARDLAVFFRELLPGSTRLLNADSGRELRHGAWTVSRQDDSIRYGLGVFVNKVGEHELFGHSGGFPGHSTRTLVCPDRRVVVCALTNCIDGGADGFAKPFFQLDDLAATATHRRSAGHDRFAGRFASLWSVLDVRRLDGRWFALDPRAGDPAEDAMALEVADDTTLRIVDGPRGGATGELIRYEFGPDGTAVRVIGPGGMTSVPFAIPAD